MENLGNNLQMREYESLQNEVQALDKKIEGEINCVCLFVSLVLFIIFPRYSQNAIPILYAHGYVVMQTYTFWDI